MGNEDGEGEEEEDGEVDEEECGDEGYGVGGEAPEERGPGEGHGERDVRPKVCVCRWTEEVRARARAVFMESPAVGGEG